MGRLWTDEQDAVYWATPRPGGRWSGGVFVPAEAEEPRHPPRPSFIREMIRAMRDIPRD